MSERFKIWHYPTREQAIQMSKSGWWVGMEPRDAALFQFTESLLCMPWGVFHDVLEAALERSVYTHEFCDRKALLAELLGDKSAPTREEIIAMLPESTLVLLEYGMPEGLDHFEDKE